MGVELEVDRGDRGQRENSAEEVVQIMDDHVYCSNDGSLLTGFEIITHPHTYDELIDFSDGSIIARYRRSWLLIITRGIIESVFCDTARRKKKPRAIVSVWTPKKLAQTWSSVKP